MIRSISQVSDRRITIEIEENRIRNLLRIYMSSKHLSKLAPVCRNPLASPIKIVKQMPFCEKFTYNYVPFVPQIVYKREQRFLSPRARDSPQRKFKPFTPFTKKRELVKDRVLSATNCSLRSTNYTSPDSPLCQRPSSNSPGKKAFVIKKLLNGRLNTAASSQRARLENKEIKYQNGVAEVQGRRATSQERQALH